MNRILYELCPLCSSPDFSLNRSADCTFHQQYRAPMPSQIDWMKCNNCSHIFTSGYWDDTALARVYAPKEGQKVGVDYEKTRPVSARIVSRVSIPIEGNRTWLDLGFGNGSLLLTAKEFGYKCYGTEIRVDNIEAMTKYEIETWQSFPDLAHITVISMMDYLEHTPYPGAVLALARKAIDPNGVLIISCPNMEAPLWSILDKGINPYWGELEHYHNFSRTRLYKLLAETGFKPFRYEISERYRCCMEVMAVPV